MSLFNYGLTVKSVITAPAAVNVAANDNVRPAPETSRLAALRLRRQAGCCVEPDVDPGTGTLLALQWDS